MSNIFDLDSLVNKLHKGNIIAHNPFDVGGGSEINMESNITGSKQSGKPPAGKPLEYKNSNPTVAGDIPISEWKNIPIGSEIDYITDYKKKPNDKVEPNNYKKNCKLVAIADDGNTINFVFKRGKYTWTAKGASIVSMSYSGGTIHAEPPAEKQNDIVKIADKVLSNDLLKERVDKLDEQISKMSANIVNIMNYIKKIKVENKLR